MSGPVIVAWAYEVPVGYRHPRMFIPEQGIIDQPAVVIRIATREEYLAAAVAWGHTDREQWLTRWGYTRFYEVSTD